MSLKSVPLTLESLEKKTIGTLKTIEYGDTIDHLVSTGAIKIVKIQDFHRAFQMLDKREIDGISGFLAPMLYYINESGIDSEYASPLVLQQQTSYLTVAVRDDVPEEAASLFLAHCAKICQEMSHNLSIQSTIKNYTYITQPEIIEPMEKYLTGRTLP